MIYPYGWVIQKKGGEKTLALQLISKRKNVSVSHSNSFSKYFSAVLIEFTRDFAVQPQRLMAKYSNTFYFVCLWEIKEQCWCFDSDHLSLSSAASTRSEIDCTFQSSCGLWNFNIKDNFREQRVIHCEDVAEKAKRREFYHTFCWFSLHFFPKMSVSQTV